MLRFLQLCPSIHITVKAVVAFSLFCALLMPDSASAAPGGCYLVENAGVEGVNGVYHQVGTHNSRSAYKHEKLDFFISYDAFGYGDEWNLTTSIGGGLDLYFIPSNAIRLPEGYWFHGLRGFYPGATIKSISCSGGNTKIMTFDLSIGKSVDGAVGGIGIFTPVSYTTGALTIQKLPPNAIPQPGDFDIQSKAINVSISNTEGDVYEVYRGLNYIYFNLDRQTAGLWETGSLGVYKFNGFRWFSISSYFIDAGKHGRVAALIYGPGIYVLGSSK